MTLEEINVTYKKWIIGFRLNKTLVYSVWGADSTDNYDDKLWVDSHLQIITFEDSSKIIETVLHSLLPLFDSENMSNWALLLKKHNHSIKPKPIYDIDKISKRIKKINFNNLAANQPGFMLELINFINLYGDYAIQIKDKDYLETWKKSSLHIFWEYMYNAYFWTIPEEELKLKQEELLGNYNTVECKESLEKILQIFRERIIIYN